MMKLPVRTLLGLLAVTGLVACSRPAPPAEPVRAVRTLVLDTGAAVGTSEFAGEIKARVESRLGFRVGGKLVERGADVGQRVQAGAVLARLDATDLQLGRAAADAGVRAAESAWGLAQAEFRRYQELRSQGFISALELERRETALQAQKAQLDQARAQADVQHNQAAYAALTANASGVVTGVDAEVGAVLAAGTPVLRLAHDGPRDVVFAVPEDGLEAVRALLGHKGAIALRPWHAEGRLPATVREVAAAADPVTRTFQVKADIGAASLQLGQTVTVLIEQPRRDAVVRVPMGSVFENKGRSAVWLLDRGAMTVKLQPVVLAGAEGETLLVGSGLERGQTIVTAGVHTLSPGQKVRLYDGPDAGSAASAPTARP